VNHNDNIQRTAVTSLGSPQLHIYVMLYYQLKSFLETSTVK